LLALRAGNAGSERKKIEEENKEEAMTGPQELREAFVAGAGFGLTDGSWQAHVFEAEALRRYPDPPQASEGKWKCTKCGCRVENPWDGGHLVETCHPTWCGPVKPVKEEQL
jgi:hypothetical protein